MTKRQRDRVRESKTARVRESKTARARESKTERVRESKREKEQKKERHRERERERERSWLWCHVETSALHAPACEHQQRQRKGRRENWKRR